MDIMADPLDRQVIATANDALEAKLATVAAGYYDDPFVEHFASHSPGVRHSARNSNQGRSVGNPPPPSPFAPSQPRGQFSHRSRPTTRHQQPIIKRGTHARVCCIDRAIAAFDSLNKSASPQKQVVLLGCGKDTSYFRYVGGRITLANGTSTERSLKWFEIDHPLVIHSKAKTAQHSKFLSSIVTLSSTEIDEYKLSCFGSSSTCHWLGHDLRESPALLMKKLIGQTFDPQAPTLFVLECVQMYLPDEASRALLESLSANCPNACVVLYDPILGSDPFGKVMEQHLLRAGVATHESSLMQTRTLANHLDKMISCNFDHVVGCDMWDAYETVVTETQRHRANQCEFLDELEEWQLIMKHYCIVICCKAENELGRELTRVGDASPFGFTSNRCQLSNRARSAAT